VLDILICGHLILVKSHLMCPKMLLLMWFLVFCQVRHPWNGDILVSAYTKHMLNIMLWVDLAKLNRKFKPKPKDLHPSLKQLTRNLLKTEINLVRPDLDFFFSNLFFFGKQVYWTKKSSDLKSIWTENDLVETETNLVWSNAIRPEVSLTHNWTEWPVCQF